MSSCLWFFSNQSANFSVDLHLSHTLFFDTKALSSTQGMTLLEQGLCEGQLTLGAVT